MKFLIVLLLLIAFGSCEKNDEIYKLNYENFEDFISEH